MAELTATRRPTFPKHRRLLKRREFVTAQRAAIVVRSPLAVLLLHRRSPGTKQRSGKQRPGERPHGDLQPHEMRLGVVASRKVGGAVERNRAKRLVREWFRHLSIELPGCDVVVVLRAGAHTAGTELARELSRSLDKARARLHRRRASQK